MLCLYVVSKEGEKKNTFADFFLEYPFPIEKNWFEFTFGFGTPLEYCFWVKGEEKKVGIGF